MPWGRGVAHHSAVQWVAFGKAAWSVHVGRSQGMPGPLGARRALEACQQQLGRPGGWLGLFILERGIVKNGAFPGSLTLQFYSLQL